MITYEHKWRYLNRLQEKMQRLVDNMPDSDQEKGRCQGDVKIVKKIMEDLEDLHLRQQDIRDKVFGPYNIEIKNLNLE